jgi:16S rRNA (guanine1207-N2)-methyltransferase
MGSQYELKLKSEETDRVYTFSSADGLNSKKSFRDEGLLLADKTEIQETDRILIIQSNYGFLGTVLGDKADRVVMQDTSARACKFSKKNAEENNLENFNVINSASVAEEGSFDKIVYAPADYEAVDVVKDRLAGAVEVLSEEGELFVAGRKKSGLKRYRKYLEKSGDVQKIGNRGSVRAYSFSFDGRDPVRKDLEKQFKAQVNGSEAIFKTAEGLFSSGKLDEGTRILLENLELSESENITDLACGYGAISVFIGKQYDCKLFLTDDDARAVKYAKENLESNGLNDFEVKTADCLDAFQDKKFDVVVSNPPTHQGKGVTRNMFQQSYGRLKEGGELWLVYNQNMQYKQELSRNFEKVEVKAEKNNFVVVKAVK